MIALLSLIIGLLLGFYGQRVYYMLKSLVEQQIEQRQRAETGVVRPGRMPPNSEPIDLTSKSGVVRQPTVEQAKLKAMEEREERLKRL